MNKNFITFILIGSIISACSYNFSTDNYFEIEEPSTEGNYIELNDFTNLDTINNQSTLKYSYFGKPNQLWISSEVYLDNERISSSWRENTGIFVIYPSDYNDGIHKIRIEHTISSGSGSLSDQKQTETFKEIEEFQFVVNRKPSDPPKISEAIIKDGSIHIKWGSIKETDYKDAFLRLKFKNTEKRIPLTEEMLALEFYVDEATVLFTGNSNTSGYDEYSSVNYSILFTSEYEESTDEGKTVFYDPSLFNVKLSFDTFEGFKYKWSAHPLYANFSVFQFSSQSSSFLGSSLGGEYRMDIPYVFGKEYNINVKPQVEEILLPNYSILNVDLDEETFGLFDMDDFFVKDILYNPNTNNYYALIIEEGSGFNVAVYIYEYSVDMEFQRKRFITEYSSPRHEYLKLVLNEVDNNFYLDARSSSYIIDKSNLGIIEQYDDETNSSIVNIRGNILATWQNSNQQLTLTNRDSNIIIYQGQSSSLGQISTDGKYAYVNSEDSNVIYSIVNNQLEKILDIGSPNYTPHKMSEVMHFEEDTVYYISNNEVFIVDLISKVIKSFPFGTGQQKLQFDPISQKILVSQNGLHNLYDIATEKTIVFESEKNKSSTGPFFNDDRTYFMHLQNGRLIHSKGIYLDLE